MGVLRQEAHEHLGAKQTRFRQTGYKPTEGRLTYRPLFGKILFSGTNIGVVNDLPKM
jgi:hypothetical protein